MNTEIAMPCLFPQARFYFQMPFLLQPEQMILTRPECLKYVGKGTLMYHWHHETFDIAPEDCQFALLSKNTASSITCESVLKIKANLPLP